MEAANVNNPYQVAFSTYSAAGLSAHMREYEQAEASAERALELSEKNQFPLVASYSRCVLGRAHAQLGRASEGIALIRQGIAGVLETGTRVGAAYFTASLAAAQARDGALIDALDTVEHALQTNPDELVNQPETAEATRGTATRTGADRTGRVRFPRGYRARAEDRRESVGTARDDEPS